MGRRYVLIAEDDALIGEMVARGLRARGCEAIAVSDGARALASVHMRRPNLVILDVGMPVIDGFGVLTALRTNPALARMPIMMLTAARSRADIIRAQALGASAYLAKPFSLPILVDRAIALMRESDGREEVPDLIEILDSWNARITTGRSVDGSS